MKDKKISIIVPVYNVEKYIDRCVKSLINQTYRNIEIILVDDGSPDRCPVICDEYEKLDERIISLHKKNGGLSDARNYGLKKATGTYILYVDSDDYIEKEACEKLISATDESIDIVCGAYREIRENMIIERRHSNILENIPYSAQEYVIASIKKNEWYAPAWLNLYKKEFLINNNLYYKAGIYYEDIEMLPRLFLANPKIKYVDFVFYNYIIRENSIMTSAITEQKKKMIIAIYNNWITICSAVQDQILKKYLYGILIKYYLVSARRMGITGWKIKNVNFKFALKYALNIKEKLKVLAFTLFPKQYIKIISSKEK